MPAKLVIGILIKQKHLLDKITHDLSARFGGMDLISAWIPFEYTSYYDKELGTPLFRRLFAFENLIQQNELPKIKLITNQIEEKYSLNGRRHVNIDPGYLLHERFVLASGKNFSHRIYLADGIYADLTLIFFNGRFEKLPWTYPDYADHSVLKVLQRIRLKYTFTLRHSKKPSQK